MLHYVCLLFANVLVATVCVFIRWASELLWCAQTWNRHHSITCLVQRLSNVQLSSRWLSRDFTTSKWQLCFSVDLHGTKTQRMGDIYGAFWRCTALLSFTTRVVSTRHHERLLWSAVNRSSDSSACTWDTFAETKVSNVQVIRRRQPPAVHCFS